MKKLLTVFAGFVLVLALGFAAVACDTGNTNDDNDDQPGTTVAVESVTLDKTSATLGVGETLTLTATVAPDNATDKTVAWTTSDEDVATVANGTVTAVAAGEATITAAAGGKSATCAVTVDDGLVDAALGEWVSDRTEPEKWEIKDGSIALTTKTEPANDWYAWQGRKSAVTMPAAEEWSVSTSLDLSEDVLARSGVRTSVWLNVQNAEGESIDWAIIQYYCDENGTKSWQYWVSEGAGEWKDIEGVVPSAGTHDLKIVFADGGIAMYIDGEESVNYDYTDVTSCKVAEVIVQSYSYGESYTVTWGVPEVSFAPVVVSDAEGLAAAVAAAQNGSYIVLEEGTYTLSAQLRFVNKSDITLVGEGEVILTQEEAFESSSKGYTSMITLAECTNVTIENITVTGAQSNGTDYAHGVNIVGCTNVTLKNVTATENAGVGILVNDSTVTLSGVATSGNGWGGVNVDVVGRDWTVPATVLTVGADCEFAEVAQIYCDDAAEKAVLEGKLDLPDAYDEYTSGTVTIWSTVEVAAE